MRIIFLNSWFGKTGKPFFDYIKKESSTTDIFCFMEVSPELYSKLSSTLNDFNGLYKEGLRLKSPEIMCGQAIFARKGIMIEKSGKVFIYCQSNIDVGFLLFSKIGIGEKKFWIGNVHGKTFPGNKFDTPIRMKQSQKIIDFFEDKNEPKIIGGDFNLELDTKSLKMFEEAGYSNLVKDFDIKTTRNEFAWKQFRNTPGFVQQYYADYVFTSPEVKVKSFEVPYMEISDHLPLILDFEI
jgi:endonuclease/exonuclease/phosphatase (EEP) superfamily protein YafD